MNQHFDQPLLQQPILTQALWKKYHSKYSAIYWNSSGANTLKNVYSFLNNKYDNIIIVNIIYKFFIILSLKKKLSNV